MVRSARQGSARRGSGSLRWLAVLVLAGAACGPAIDPTVLVRIDPPVRWRDDLAAERAAKDDQFRRDPETPLRAEDIAGFPGLHYWEADPKYYFAGPLNLYEQPRPFTIVTTEGKPRPCAKVGWLSFPLDGRYHKLQVYRLLDSEASSWTDSLFLPFMDGTSGRETYGAGRYVQLTGPPGGPYVLDFNTAYNPYCAYGAPERFACPKTPEENRLDVRIEAGEMGYKIHETDS